MITDPTQINALSELQDIVNEHHNSFLTALEDETNVFGQFFLTPLQQEALAVARAELLTTGDQPSDVLIKAFYTFAADEAGES